MASRKTLYMLARAGRVKKVGYLSYCKTPGTTIKKTRLTEAQIVFALCQTDASVAGLV